MINKSQRVSKISELLSFDVSFKKTQDILNTQRDSPLALGVKTIVCILHAWFSWYIECEWVDSVEAFTNSYVVPHFFGIESCCSKKWDVYSQI